MDVRKGVGNVFARLQQAAMQGGRHDLVKRSLVIARAAFRKATQPSRMVQRFGSSPSDVLSGESRPSALSQLSHVIRFDWTKLLSK